MNSDPITAPPFVESEKSLTESFCKLGCLKLSRKAMATLTPGNTL